MKALILAAGYGSRLGELTRDKPKPLMLAGGKPLIQHVIEKLCADGFKEIAVNLHYHADQLSAFLQELEIPDLKLYLSHESELLGTGGGIARAQTFLGESAFVVHNSDVYSDLHLSELLKSHETSGAIATLAVRNRDTSRYLLFDEQGSLVGWENQDTGQGRRVREVENIQRFAFSGMYALSPELRAFYPEEQEVFSIITAFMNAAEQGKIVKAYQHEDYWIDIGTPEKLDTLDRYLQERS